MKCLVAYYSRTGNTKKVAEEIANTLGCDTEEIKTKKDRKGVWGYLISGKEATQKKEAEILPLKRNPLNYDLIIIGTPVWGWTVSSPIRAYLSQNKKKFENLAFFCTCGGSGEQGTFNEMKKVCDIEPIATLGLKTKEVISGGYVFKIKEYIRKILTY